MEENNKIINILPHVSYIMSGPPCSGKSTFLNKLMEQGVDPAAVVCPDTIRETILGAKSFVDDKGVGKSLYGWYYESDTVFDIAKSMIKARLAQGLQVFVDATSLNDASRKFFAELFQDYNKQFQVLIFNENPDVVKARLKVREYRFEQQTNIVNAIELLQKDSIYPYAVIDSSYKPQFITALTSFKDFIVVGDTHGLLEPLINLLEKDGFEFDGTKFTHDSKRVLFLGDVVCRGNNSIQLLEIVKNTIAAGHGWMIKGNHEIQLIRAIDALNFRGTISPDMSISTTQALKEFCTYPVEQQNDLFNFLRSVPYSLSFLINKETLIGENIDKNDDSQLRIAFGHSPLNYYHPTKTPGEELAYNSIPYEFDIQEAYEKGYLMDQNKYIYIHARHPNSKKIQATSTFSLSDYESHDGNLVSFDLHAYLKGLKNNNFELSHQLFEDSIKKEPTNFDILEKNKQQIAFKNGISFLNQKGIFAKPEKDETHTHPMGLKMYVRKKMKEITGESIVIEKCNGLVVDTAGEIILNPRPEFKATTEMLDDEKVYSVSHSNHNIFYVYKNPYNQKVEVAGHKTFNTYKEDIDFVLSKMDKLEDFFRNNNYTLGFETRIMDDKNSFDYVLTYGQKNSFKSAPMSEYSLDELAQFIEVTRPLVKESEMKDVREKARDTTGMGYIVRKVSSPSEIFYIPSDLIIFQTISEILEDDNNAKFFFTKPELFINKFLTDDMKHVAHNIAAKTEAKKFLASTSEERKMIIFNNMHPEDQIIHDEATARSLENEKNRHKQESQGLILNVNRNNI